MKGRKPKAPGTRQRRNKPPSSAATLAPESESSRVKVPKMPAKVGGWLPEATEAWEELFKSPMAPYFLKADRYRLKVLIDMVDRYFRGETDLAPQIRLEGDSFGTSPLARRRLEWGVRDAAGSEEGPEAPAVGDGRAPAPKKARDLRNVLRGDFK